MPVSMYIFRRSLFLLLATGFAVKGPMHVAQCRARPRCRRRRQANYARDKYRRRRRYLDRWSESGWRLESDREEGRRGEGREESSKVVPPRWKREGVLRGKWTMLGETRVPHPRGRDRPQPGHTFCVVGHPPGGTERERERGERGRRRRGGRQTTHRQTVGQSGEALRNPVIKCFSGRTNRSSPPLSHWPPNIKR